MPFSIELHSPGQKILSELCVICEDVAPFLNISGVTVQRRKKSF